MSLKTYHGSCNCGRVSFEIKLDLSKGTFKCNCSVCTKTRFWAASVKPEAFKLLSGESDLAAWGQNVGHYFCRHCGVKPFGKGDSPDSPDGGGEFVAINLGVLDDLDPEEWAKAPVQYLDGRNNNWFERPKFIEHL